MVDKQLQYNISQSKGSKTMKFGQLNEHTKRNIFLQKSCKKEVGGLVPGPFLLFWKALYGPFFQVGKNFLNKISKNTTFVIHETVKLGVNGHFFFFLWKPIFVI